MQAGAHPDLFGFYNGAGRPFLSLGRRSLGGLEPALQLRHLARSSSAG